MKVYLERIVDMEEKLEIKERKIANDFKQFSILLWKNGKLFKHNIGGTIAEILVAAFFAFLILILRHFSDTSVFNEQNK